jgi:hypothetical protein
VLNKLDPRVDSDVDGSTTIGETRPIPARGHTSKSVKRGDGCGY